MNTLLFTQASDAVPLLNRGEIIALPTETVYGLAGNATDPEIVKKIFAAKERPSFDPLIVHISSKYLSHFSPLEALVSDQIIDEKVLSWPNRSQIEHTMKHFWPGPLTLILPKGSRIPAEVTSNQNTVGIRCPAHPMFQEVLSLLSFPLAAPSANRFGRISPTSAEHVKTELDGRIAGILNGGVCDIGVESTIINIRKDAVTLLRPGKVSLTEIQALFQVPVSLASTLQESNPSTPLAPGMLDEHYAPRKPLYLLPFPFYDPRAKEYLKKFPDTHVATAGFLAMSSFPNELRSSAKQILSVLSHEKSLPEMAQKLFSTMRAFDESEKVSVIFADSPEDTREGLGASIFDRLKRASRNKPPLS